MPTPTAPNPTPQFAATHIHKPSGRYCNILNVLRGGTHAMVDMGQDRSNPFPTVAVTDLVPLCNFTPTGPNSHIPTPALGLRDRDQTQPNPFETPPPGFTPTPHPMPVPTMSTSAPTSAPTMPVPTQPIPQSHFPISLVLSEKDCDKLTHILQNEVSAHHNWIAGAIENKDFDRAANITRELRAYQSIATSLRRTIREAAELATKSQLAADAQIAEAKADAANSQFPTPCRRHHTTLQEPNAMPIDLRDPGPTWAQHISNELQRRSHLAPGTPLEKDIASFLFHTLRQHAPSGSGFDNGTKLNETSTPNRLVFLTDFHHMNAHGVYVGWTHHTVVVTPAFTGFYIRVTGPSTPRGHSGPSSGIKDYITEQFNNWLSSPAKG